MAVGTGSKAAGRGVEHHPQLPSTEAGCGQTNTSSPPFGQVTEHLSYLFKPARETFRTRESLKRHRHWGLARHGPKVTYTTRARVVVNVY